MQTNLTQEIEVCVQCETEHYRSLPHARFTLCNFQPAIYHEQGSWIAQVQWLFILLQQPIWAIGLMDFDCVNKSGWRKGDKERGCWQRTHQKDRVDWWPLIDRVGCPLIWGLSIQFPTTAVSAEVSLGTTLNALNVLWKDECNKSFKGAVKRQINVEENASICLSDALGWWPALISWTLLGPTQENKK